MPLTNPIPEVAAEVVKILRQDVPRPEGLPVLLNNSGLLHGKSLRWLIGKDKAPSCPMGLHPESWDALPADPEAFAGGAVDEAGVDAFYEWWDVQQDAEAAVEAVWPTKGDTDGKA